MEAGGKNADPKTKTGGDDVNDPLSSAAIAERLDLLNRMTGERLRNEHPADRDRRLQQFLAQAMSPRRRLQILNQMTDFAIQMRRNGGESPA